MALEYESLDQLYLQGVPCGPILGIEIEEKAEAHGFMRITFQIDESLENALLYELKSRQAASLIGKQGCLFTGLLDRIAFFKSEDVRKAELTFLTATCLLDAKKKFRSFQDTSMTYRALLDLILSDYPGAAYIFSGADAPIGRLLVQYQETDWAFLKRVFSEVHCALAPSSSAALPRFYVGVPDAEAKISLRLEGLEKDEREVRLFSSLDIPEPAFTDHEFVSGERTELFARLSYQGRALSVSALSAKLVKSRLEWRLKARGAEAILQYPIYPISLVGIALEGSIRAVRGNQVQIHMDIDDPYQNNDCYWFPYATMSASLNGTGWYYMPEVGDRVRVEFPTKHAEDALVINSASIYEVSGGGEDSMSTPSTKYLTNTAGQKLSMGEGSVVLTAANAAGVSMDGGGNLSIWAAGNIAFCAANSITVQGENITIHAAEAVKAASDQGSGMEMKSNIDLTGAEVKIN